MLCLIHFRKFAKKLSSCLPNPSRTRLPLPGVDTCLLRAGPQTLPCSTTSAMHANNNSMEVRSDPIESAKSNLFDTSSWGEFCDVTLTLKQGHQPESGGWVKIEDYRCRQAFRHFMNLSTEQCMDPHFVGTANVFVYYPYLKKARSAPAHCVHGSVARPVDGIFIVQLNCPRTSMLLPLRT